MNTDNMFPISRKYRDMARTITEKTPLVPVSNQYHEFARLSSRILEFEANPERGFEFSSQISHHASQLESELFSFGLVLLSFGLAETYGPMAGELRERLSEVKERFGGQAA